MDSATVTRAQAELDQIEAELLDAMNADPQGRREAAIVILASVQDPSVLRTLGDKTLALVAGFAAIGYSQVNFARLRSE